MQVHIAEANFYITWPAPATGAAPSSDLRVSEPARTPADIPAIGQYWPGQGGILVATLPPLLGMPARHLIAGTAETQLAYGSYNEDEPTAASHIDGYANTQALIDSPHDHPAATWCRAYEADGHKDFFLPSRLDLLFAFYMSPGTFEKEGWHWSSTQASRGYAFVQGFADGGSPWYIKVNKWRVRPFRQIYVSA